MDTISSAIAPGVICTQIKIVCLPASTPVATKGNVVFWVTMWAEFAVSSRMIFQTITVKVPVTRYTCFLICTNNHLISCIAKPLNMFCTYCFYFPREKFQVHFELDIIAMKLHCSPTRVYYCKRIQ